MPEMSFEVADLCMLRFNTEFVSTLELMKKNQQKLNEMQPKQAQNLRKVMHMKYLQKLCQGFHECFTTVKFLPPKIEPTWVPGTLHSQIAAREICPTLHRSKLTPSKYLKKRGITAGRGYHEYLNCKLTRVEKVMTMKQMCDSVNETINKFSMDKSLITAVIFKLETEQYSTLEKTKKMYMELPTKDMQAYLRMAQWMHLTDQERLKSVLDIKTKITAPPRKINLRIRNKVIDYKIPRISAPRKSRKRQIQ